MSSTFRFVWDGNVLLHETFKKDNSENTELTTWVFEGFVPTAKLVNGKAYSIISDHLGTPILAIDSEGNEVWNRQLDIYGRVKREIKASSLGDDVRPFIPFLYQGQYYDFETNLAYNRFRYYSPETGAYISQDPIGLAGNNPTLYAFVKNLNTEVDVFGLDLHHAYPKFMGGRNKEQKLVDIAHDDHVQLHRDMNTFLETQTKNIDGEVVSMRPKRGNSGLTIQENFSQSEREAALDEFYKKYGDKYPGAKEAYELEKKALHANDENANKKNSCPS
ncbi:RHS repeat domain-containing protein [Capnocytophaga gingivalis]|uniref:RHS repeat-associated core domain-containing protein n=1 Tax=Capnocytophaga gingivalis TaxID=1017 RepID=A0ABU5YDZ8_9FLAO|nr:RHS repeat-associated core domain-containing protein [Capnocytophaga gingivalis]MEB3041589.1 RHS repeat-associated core domain-containing protein [Capnocytophaga gingivalis]